MDRNPIDAPRPDHGRVTELLGREPLGAYDVVVRDATGDPVVIANAPLLGDGTPMPTRYWLVGADAVRRVGRLEAAGGVREAEATLDPDHIAQAHRRYALERDRLIPADHVGPVPSGGVGGTRTGVKCLHAHYAWHLAGGDDPVGRWVADRLDAEGRTMVVSIAADRVEFTGGLGWRETRPIDPDQLWAEGLGHRDPPAPEDLTNALGRIDDVLAELGLDHGELADLTTVVIGGELAEAVVRVELGRDDVEHDVTLDRDQAEDVFRTVATEARADRRHNPGLPSGHVDAVVGAACVVVGLMRRFHLDHVVFRRPGGER